ncbi:protection of telomeres protein 1b-like, partial [Asparagus officinalis]
MAIGGGSNDVNQTEDCTVAKEEKMKAWRTMEKPSSSHCIYLPIAEAKKTINKLVNIFVKISEVGFPRKSKGTDYVLVLKVVDQSYPAPGLSVTFFGENMRKLPDVRSVGDVISLHYVEMKVRNGEVCCLFGKKVSSFALFHGEINVEVTPYQTFPMYYAAEHATNLLLQLRKLPLKHQPDAGFIKCLSLLRNIEVGKTFDIICKILCAHRISRDEWMLFVWDGTDLPPATFQSNLDMEEEQPIPLFLEPLPLSKEILRSFPLEGAVLRIFEDNCFEPINHFRGGDYWVRLCNVTCEIQSGLWRGVVNSSSKVFKLSNEDA